MSEVPAFKKSVGAARIVVLKTVYHQAMGADATSVVTKYARELASDEQVYTRYLTVGDEWKPLEKGWIEEASLLVVENREGTVMPVSPTEEEIVAARSRRLLIGVSVPGVGVVPIASIPAGESVDFEPVAIDSLQLRWTNGKGKVGVYVYPR